MMKGRQENVWGGKMKEKKLKEKQKVRLFSCENKERFAFPQQKKILKWKQKPENFWIKWCLNICLVAQHKMERLSTVVDQSILNIDFIITTCGFIYIHTYVFEWMCLYPASDEKCINITQENLKKKISKS